MMLLKDRAAETEAVRILDPVLNGASGPMCWDTYLYHNPHDFWSMYDRFTILLP